MSSVIGPTVRLNGFSPNPRAVRLLKRSIGTSGRGGFVTLHEKIVADQAGLLHLNISARAGGAGNIAENGWTIGDDTESVPCEAVRLDELFQTETVDFIRIDTEGSEVLILTGALGILARSPTIKLCIEWHLGMMRARGDVDTLVAKLEGLGFRFWRIDAETLTPLASATLLAQPPCEVLVARTLDAPR